MTGNSQKLSDLDKVRETRLRWFGRVQGKDLAYIGRLILKTEQPGRMQRGNPKRRFMDMVREDMRIGGVREEDVEDRER